MGGASQQFAVRKESGKDARAKDAGVKDFETFSDPLGAVTFRAIVSQGKGRAASASPNPFTLKEIQAADAAVAKSSGVLGNASLKKLIATRGGQVVGVGGVLAESLPNQTQKTEYTVEDIDRALSERAGLTDGEIGGKYADTQTTNLILVRALMRALGIQKVRALAVRNHAGLLTANEWWGK
jgi:exopolyphosphatase/guanosine-5'-triphosphate,3'-diphosphate pyrophosphatase